MLLKQKILSAIALIILFGSTIAPAVPAYAATSNTNGNNFFTGLIQFISQKFGLDHNQVSTAVNDYKTQKKGIMQQKMDDREKKRLDDLVTQGKITSAQEAAIIAERATLRSKYNPADFKSLTPEQRKQKMTDEMNELKSWAKSQNIEVKYVIPGFGMFPKGATRRFDRHSIPTPTQTQ